MLFQFKIFSNVGLNVISSKFESAISFTQSASKLLVTEVRRRASNQSTEAAAQAIAAYMQVNIPGIKLPHQRAFNFLKTDFSFIYTLVWSEFF